MQTLDQLGAKADQINTKTDQANTKLDTISSKTEKRIPIDPSAPGFTTPYSIPGPGSYYLTGNITTSGTAISIAAVANVTLDLNGFRILNTSNTATSNVFGIVINSSGNVTVRNGHVIGAVSYNPANDTSSGGGFSSGINVIGNPTNVMISDVSVSGCFAYGIYLPAGQNMVKNCVVSSVGNFGIVAENVSDCIVGDSGYGISANDGGTIHNCVARNNHGENFSVGNGVHIAHCSARSSVIGNGFALGIESSISDCSSERNGGKGITVGDNSTVARCSAHTNGGRGIETADAASVTDCSARNNGGDNIYTFFNSQVSHCTADGSANGNGISLGQNSSLTDSSANFNKLSGIAAGPNCTFANVAANQNQGHGIAPGDGAALHNCVADGNGTAGTGYGIAAGNGITLTHCLANANRSGGIITGVAAIVDGCSTWKNSGTSGGSGTGIIVSDSSTVTNNSVRENDGDGLRLGSGCVATNNTCDFNGRQVTGGSANMLVTGSQNRIDSNNFTSNAQINGIGLKVAAGGNVIVRNSARGNTVNYSIVGGNTDAAVITPGTAFTTANPWANFSY